MLSFYLFSWCYVLTFCALPGPNCGGFIHLMVVVVLVKVFPKYKARRKRRQSYRLLNTLYGATLVVGKFDETQDVSCNSGLNVTATVRAPSVSTVLCTTPS